MDSTLDDSLSTFGDVHILGFPTNVGFIALDFIEQRFGVGILLSGCPEPMEHEPCRLLSNPDGSGDLVTTDPVPAVANHPRHDEPFA
jgi:hypothetical protein